MTKESEKFVRQLLRRGWRVKRESAHIILTLGNETVVLGQHLNGHSRARDLKRVRVAEERVFGKSSSAH